MCVLEIEKEQVKDEAKDQQMSPPPTPLKWIVAAKKICKLPPVFSRGICAKCFSGLIYLMSVFDLIKIKTLAFIDWKSFSYDNDNDGDDESKVERVHLEGCPEQS